MKTKPIFESKPKLTASVQTAGCNCPCNCPCRHRLPSEPSPATTTAAVAVSSLHHTEIVDDTQPKQDKQQQTKPSSIAYVITFQGDGKDTKGRKPPSEKDQVYHRSTSSTDTSSSANRSNGGASEETDLLPLKDQFQRNRPGTLLRLKERQKCVNELNKLRAERNKQRKKLLLLTSDDSLKKCDAKERLPPPPLGEYFEVFGKLFVFSEKSLFEWRGF